MQCPKCATENPSEAQSCLSCGAGLERSYSAEHANQGTTRAAIPAPESFSYSLGTAEANYHTELVAEENSSGWAYARPTPVWARGWTFAGAVPFGLFALYNGMHVYGLVGILLSVFGLPFVWLLWPLSIGYIVYLGLRGRELAWRGRRFTDRLHYEQTMRSWNIAGAWSLAIVAVLYLLWIGLVLSSFGGLPMLSPAPADPSCYT